MILIHELAHVRRHDMWVNLLQRLAEAVLFFNPAAWYLSRRISTLREFCCDELTCRTLSSDRLQSKTEYALALLRVVELARGLEGLSPTVGTAERDDLVALAAGGRTASQLRARVASLFGDPDPEPLRLSAGAWLTVTALALVLLLGPVSWRLVAKSADGASETPAIRLSVASNDPSLAKNDVGPPPAAGNEFSPNVPIDVSGAALDEATGKPIAGATIHIESDGNELRKTMTDKAGRYAFHAVQLPIARFPDNHAHDCGLFSIYGEAAGHGFAWRPRKWFFPNPYLNTFMPNPSRDQPEHYLPGDKIELDLRFAKATRIRGRAVDEKGRPIAGARVWISHCERIPANGDGSKQKGPSGRPPNVLDPNGFSLAEAGVPAELRGRRTAADGSFEFSQVPSGCRIDVVVAPEGFVARRNWIVTQAGLPDRHDGVPVGDAREEIRFTFRFPHEVAFQVLCEDTGKPAPKVLVTGGGGDGTTNAEGHTMLKVPPGEYAFEMIPAYETPYLVSKGSFTVGPKSSAPVIGRLRRAAQVGVRIVDQETGRGIPGVDLWMALEGGGRTDFYSTSWEASTRIVHRVRKRSDHNGDILDLIEPGKHRIGVGSQSYPKGYEITEPDGQEIDCRAGELTIAKFQLRRLPDLANGPESPPAPPQQPVNKSTAISTDLSRYVVMIEAESRPHAIRKSFPAIVMASSGGKSLLLSASWGAEPFPLDKPGVPIGALFLSEWKNPVGIVAYDIARGIAVFSVNQVLEPIPRECFTVDLGKGDLLTSLPLAKDDASRSSRVLAVEETYASEATDRETVAVKHAARIDFGKWQCGSPMLKDGKIAAIFLNNGVPPDSEKFFGYAVPARYALGAFAELSGEQAAPSAPGKIAEPVFIVARHAMIYDGRVITWDEIRDWLKNMVRRGPVVPRFEFTNGAIDKLHDIHLEKLEREFEFKETNLGMLWPRAGRRYDAVKSQADLTPKPSDARQGSVRISNGRSHDGSPVVGAQVVLLPDADVESDGGFTVTLRQGRLREAYVEIVTETDAAGLFVVYPRGPFQLVVLHKDGFAVRTSDEFRNPVIKLEPWVRVEGTLDRRDNPKQSVNLTSTVNSGKAWPPITLIDYDVPMAENGSFQDGYAPPGDILVQRHIPGEQDRSYGIAAQSIRGAKPGSIQRVTIGPMTAEDRQSLERLSKPGRH
jgi:hypothetical protein